jgi:hypothetical protein
MSEAGHNPPKLSRVSNHDLLAEVNRRWPMRERCHYSVPCPVHEEKTG